MIKHNQADKWLLERWESPLGARLLGNLLLHPPEKSPLEDPELDFLMSCAGFCLVVCGVAYQNDLPRTMQTLAKQQEVTCTCISGALRNAEGYFSITAELENQLVGLMIPREPESLEEGRFEEMLRETLGPALRQLTREQGIPVYTTYSVQRELSRVSHGYGLMKNAMTYLDYIQGQQGELLQVRQPEPKPHIGLWNQMEASSQRFVEGFLAGDEAMAAGEVDRTIEAITQWIAPSKDSLLADVQYYFDLILNRLTTQFGEGVVQDVALVDAIFEAPSLRQLRNNLRETVHLLYRNMRRNATDGTFAFYLKVRQYMDDHIRDYSLSAGGIAEAFSVSPQLLSIQFKKCFGITPMRYMEQKRVELIQQALLTTDCSLDTICQQVGMGSVSTLHRVFQKHCGQSPGVFRKTAANSQ